MGSSQARGGATFFLQTLFFLDAKHFPAHGIHLEKAGAGVQWFTLMLSVSLYNLHSLTCWILIPARKQVYASACLQCHYLPTAQNFGKLLYHGRVGAQEDGAHLQERMTSCLFARALIPGFKSCAATQGDQMQPARGSPADWQPGLMRLSWYLTSWQHKSLMPLIYSLPCNLGRFLLVTRRKEGATPWQHMRYPNHHPS